MGIYRTVKRENPFAQIDKYVINDSNIDFRAKGIMTYLLSKPNGWKVRLADVVNHTKEGERSVRSGMKDLETAGYIHKFADRDEKGKINEWVYEVYERPASNPHCASAEVGNQHVDSPQVDKSHYSNNDFSNKEFSNNEEEDEDKQRFAQVFDFYENNFGGTHGEVVTKFIDEWVPYYPADIINEALAIAKDNFAKKPPHYAHTILKDWYFYKLQTLDEIRAFRAKKNESQGGSKQQSSSELFSELRSEQS